MPRPKPFELANSTTAGFVSLLWAKLAAAALTVAFAGMGVVSSISCAQEKPSEPTSQKLPTSPPQDSGLATATFGGGCFWCVEAVFENMKGVKEVVSGYAGGRNANPTYQQVCTGRTGHAEVCQIHYDPNEVSFDELLQVFWKTHDPTTLNRQGPDIGTQYRSVIFYHDQEQQQIAEKYKKKLDESGAFESKIVTEISELPTFYPAEDYHQDYYEKNPYQSYCAAIVRPKVEKFKQAFADKVKGN